MKSFAHWTPKYLFSRFTDVLYRKTHPDDPWLTPKAIKYLDAWIKSDHIAAEFGSGSSTIWLAKRVAVLTSVEHDQNWYMKVSQMLNDCGLENVNYILASEISSDYENVDESDYLKKAIDLPENKLDLALVDGKHRSQCSNILINKLRPGGLLIIDNANLYLPCESNSPNSRSIIEGPASTEWKFFWNSVQDWEKVWTSNGVFDTALFFKPDPMN